jgi:hypothetical protein
MNLTMTCEADLRDMIEGEFYSQVQKDTSDPIQSKKVTLSLTCQGSLLKFI